MALEVPILAQPLDKSKIQDLVHQQATLDLDWDRLDLVLKIPLLLLPRVSTLDQLIRQAYSVRYYYHDHDRYFIILILRMIRSTKTSSSHWIWHHIFPRYYDCNIKRDRMLTYSPMTGQQPQQQLQQQQQGQQQQQQQQQNVWQQLALIRAHWDPSSHLCQFRVSNIIDKRA